MKCLFQHVTNILLFELIILNQNEKLHFFKLWMILTVLSKNVIWRKLLNRPLQFNPIQDGTIWDSSWMAHLPKICHTSVTPMKLGRVMPYLKEDPKNIWITWHLLSSADISIFSPKSAKIAMSRKTVADCILVLDFWLY